MKDSRVKFANNVCQMLYDRHDGNFTSCNFIDDIICIRKHFENHVRNIYECVNEIPLFLYADYLECEQPDEIYCEEFEGMTLEQIYNALEEECHEFYG